MGSNSIRVSFELFEPGQRQGEAVPEFVALLRAPAGAERDLQTHTAPEAQLWAFKRAQQRRDIASIQRGRSTNESMSWFSGGRARRAKAVDSPF